MLMAAVDALLPPPPLPPPHPSSKRIAGLSAAQQHISHQHQHSSNITRVCFDPTCS